MRCYVLPMPWNASPCQCSAAQCLCHEMPCQSKPLRCYARARKRTSMPTPCFTMPLRLGATHSLCMPPHSSAHAMLRLADAASSSAMPLHARSEQRPCFAALRNAIAVQCLAFARPCDADAVSLLRNPKPRLSTTALSQSIACHRLAPALCGPAKPLLYRAMRRLCNSMPVPAPAARLIAMPMRSYALPMLVGAVPMPCTHCAASPTLRGSTPSWRCGTR